MNRNITIPQIEVETFIDQAEQTRKSLLNTLDIMKQLGTEIENEKKTSVEGSATAVQTNNTISNAQRSRKYKFARATMSRLDMREKRQYCFVIRLFLTSRTIRVCHN